MSRHEVLTAAMQESYDRLRTRLDGLTDHEFFWQPAANSWTIYEDSPGHWTYHYEIPDPVPAPITTIGWQVVHIATCKVMYHEWAFGPARLTFPDLEIPHSATTAVQFLEDGHSLLRDALANTSESDLDEPRKTNWGELWPAGRIFWSMSDHDALHGGTVGFLRDLYYWTR